MKKNLIKFFLKYILPTFIIQGSFLIYTYFDLGYIVPFGFHRVVIFLGILFIVSMFWALVYQLEITGEELLKADWRKRLVFIVVAIIVIYLFKAGGRI